jgi:hypothetical protein
VYPFLFSLAAALPETTLTILWRGNGRSES